jgi:hypothetical protein
MARRRSIDRTGIVADLGPILGGRDAGASTGPIDVRVARIEVFDSSISVTAGRRKTNEPEGHQLTGLGRGVDDTLGLDGLVVRPAESSGSLGESIRFGDPVRLVLP